MIQLKYKADYCATLLRNYHINQEEVVADQ